MFRFYTPKRLSKVTAAVTAALTASVLFTDVPADALPLAHRALLRAVVRAGASAVRPATTSTTSVVYVADQANNVVWVFNNPAAPPPVGTGGTTSPRSVKPLRYIATGMTPSGISVDSSGNLYVASFFGNSVQEFAPGGSAPLRTLSTGLNGPLDVKVSLSGTLYVTSAFGIGASANSSVVIYGPNGTAPIATWLSPIANATLFAIALQSPDYAPGGDAYVAYSNVGSSGGILWCPVGSASCFDTDIATSGWNKSLAFQYGTFPLTLLVPDEINNVVDVYHLRRGRTPASAFSVAAPTGVAFDPGFSNVFVASNPPGGTSSVNEYRYPDGAAGTIFTPAQTPTRAHLVGVAVYPSATY